MAAKSVDYYYAARVGYPYQHAVFEPFRMLETSKAGFWIMESVPRNATTTASKLIETASRTGFFIHTDSSQCTIKNLHWEQQ